MANDLGENLRPIPAAEAKPPCGSHGNLKAPGGHRQHHQEEVCVVPIHRRPDLLLPCAHLVNGEWPRSSGARVHSLQKSCQEFPVSLVLLLGSREEERLLGHARLSRVVGHGASLFVESVVVSEAERGKGYGRLLMEQTERYARGRGFRRLCLTTHDKQRFYAHLGYAPAAPVQSAGTLGALLQHLQPSPSPVSVPGTPPPVAPPPPPPAVPPLHSLPPPPPPPPTSIPPLPPPPPPPFAPPSSPLHSVPPPPPLPLSLHPSVERGGHMTTIDTPYRDARGTPIFWMHKDI